jgi:hypothetical protein
MPRRIFAATILFVALDLATNAACAQSVADVDHALHAMQLRMRALNAARKNLQKIEYHREDHEADAARAITDADTMVFTEAVKVFTVGFIVTGMKCPDDLRFTLKQFGVVAESLVTTADVQLALVNESLNSVAVPDARTEATSIRDLIVDLRDFLRPFAVKG